MYSVDLFAGMKDVILVVSDTESLYQTMLASAQDAGYQVMLVHTFPDANRVISTALPLILVMEPFVSGIPTVSFIRYLRSWRRTKALRVIVASTTTSDHDCVEALDAGADDHIMVPFSASELLSRVRSVTRVLPPPSALRTWPVTFGSVTLDRISRRVISRADGKEIEIRLGPIGFELLHFFLSRPETLFARDEILRAVWRGDTSLSSQNVAVQISLIRAEMRRCAANVAIESVKRQGYRMVTLSGNQ